MPGGTNLPKVGVYNRSLVMTTIQMAGRISRMAIAERTGLTPQTVSVIVRNLIGEGLVREDGLEPSEGGKPRTFLRVEATAGYAIGVHLDPATVTCAVVDLTGGAIASARREFTAQLPPEQVIVRTVGTAKRLLAKARVPDDLVLGVGVACPGPIDQDKGMMVSPPRRDRWTEVPIKDLFESSTGLPVTIDNDATASAIGERWAGVARSATDFAHFYLGSGIGGGVFVANQIYRGTSLNAGEFGHLVVERRGTLCYCGRRGCLEAMCRPAAIVAATHAKLLNGQNSSLRRAFAARPASVDHYSICKAAVAGDPVARSVIDKVADYLAQAAVDVVNVVDPELIVIGGYGALHVGGIYRDRMMLAVAKQSLARKVHQPRIEVSDIAENAGAIGAASLVLHVAFAPRLDLLLSD